MKKFTIVATTVLVVAGAGIAFTDGERRANHARARLNGYQEVTSISTVATGRLDLRIDDEAERIEYRLRYSGIEGGAATASHIHFAQRHTNGSVVAFLCGGGDKPPCPPLGGEVEGVIDPADIGAGATERGIEAGAFAEFVRAIRAGATYVNVHSTPRWPGGEIRGQIRAADDDDDRDDDR
jgi:hypothetical protein